MTAPVAIIMGSQSDWETMRHAAETLAALGIDCEKRIVSAHRTPDRLFAFAKGAKAAGFKVIIAGAGGAAHLPGMAAALTELPVFGVPVESKALSGHRFAVLDRADAGRRSRRHAGDRKGRRHQRRAARGQRAGAERRRARRAARRLAQAADGRGQGAPGGIGVTASGKVKLKPGDTIGILGGGQLGRMLAMAAARLGLKCQVFSPDPDSPAFDVVLNATCAEYADVEALELFANDVDVITYEFENVPAATAMVLAARRPVLPAQKILETTQDRLIEKDFVKRLGIGTADYADVSSVETLRAAIARIGLPAVIKTRRFGYDGKGQAIIREGDDPDSGLGRPRHQIRDPRSLRSLRARDLRDRRALGGRRGRMLRRHRKRAPRSHPEDLARAGRDIGCAGRTTRAPSPRRSPTRSTMSACSRSRLFVVAGNGGPHVLVNEIAPRVHNSGHWTLDGASISQFEQHIRAIAGWPLGKPVRHGQVTMTNLIGDDILDYEQWLTVPGATVHLYGKGAPRPGRKMGHVTEVAPASKK